LETSNNKQEFFGEERLGRFIETQKDLPAEQFADALFNEVAAWSGPGSQQTDDITLVVLDLS
jgi:serine phosphatase RsbU (regulator of sigma subunit)